MTDERDAIEQADDRDLQGARGPERRPYASPVLVEYGTVAKLTQTGVGSFNDAGMMMMMACL